jgi:hypothetical protein
MDSNMTENKQNKSNQWYKDRNFNRGNKVGGFFW